MKLVHGQKQNLREPLREIDIHSIALFYCLKFMVKYYLPQSAHLFCRLAHFTIKAQLIREYLLLYQHSVLSINATKSTYRE